MVSMMSSVSVALVLLSSLVNAQTTTTTAAPSAPTSLSASWVYVGCYSDALPTSGSNSSTHALSADYLESSNMTQSMCVSFCQSGGYGYAGVEYSTQCTCGNDLSSTSVLTSGESDCQSNCGGNTTTACGGVYYMSLFRDSALLAAASASSSSSAVSTSTSSMVTSLRSSSTSTASASASGATSVAASSGKSTSGGVIGGAVVGVIAGIAIIVGIFLYWKKNKARKVTSGPYGVSHSRGPSDDNSGLYVDTNGQTHEGGVAGVGAGAGWVRNQSEDKNGNSKESYGGRAEEKMIQMENLPPAIPPRPLPAPPSTGLMNETNRIPPSVGHPPAPSAYQMFNPSMRNSPPSSESSHQQGLYQHRQQPYGYQEPISNEGQNNPFRTPQGSPVADSTAMMAATDSFEPITAGPVQRSISISKRKPVPSLSAGEIAAGVTVRNSAYDGIDDAYDGIAYDSPYGHPMGASSTGVGTGWESKPMKPMNVEKPLGWQG